MEYHFKVHKEKTGFWARCMELEGCVTQGDSLKELEANAQEALELFLSEPESSRILFALPQKRPHSRQILKVRVPVGIAFAVLLKHLRVKRKLTQRETADRLGLKNISAYQRLESPKKANPELVTLARVKKVFPEMRIDKVLESSAD